MTKLGIPRLGIYSQTIANLFGSVGYEVVMPSKVSEEIIQLGVMNSSDMICFPYKVTLGQLIWCLEHGAEDLVMFNTHGLCRFKHYHQLQAMTLKNLGYFFKMHTLSKRNFIPSLMKMTGSPVMLLQIIIHAVRELVELEESTYHDGHYDLKVGIVGEIYTMAEPDINFDIVAKLKRMGVGVDLSVTPLEFIKKAFKLDLFQKREEKKLARSLLKEKIGGHGFDSIYNTAWYGKNGFDGVIHLMPLSCMPESTVESLVDQVANEYRIPLYRFPIDESNFETGFNTRLETFVSMLKRRGRC